MSTHYYALADELEQPTKRMARATHAIRRLAKHSIDLGERCDYLYTRVAEMEAENKRLRATQTPTMLDHRDARIAQLDTEVKRLNKLLNDYHQEGVRRTRPATREEADAAHAARDDNHP